MLTKPCRLRISILKKIKNNMSVVCGSKFLKGRKLSQRDVVPDVVENWFCERGLTVHFMAAVIIRGASLHINFRSRFWLCECVVPPIPRVQYLQLGTSRPTQKSPDNAPPFRLAAPHSRKIPYLCQKFPLCERQRSSFFSPL